MKKFMATGDTSTQSTQDIATPTAAPIAQPQSNAVTTRIKQVAGIVNNPIGYICIGSSVAGYFVAKHYNKSKIGGVVLGFFAPLVVMLGAFIVTGGPKKDAGASW